MLKIQKDYLQYCVIERHIFDVKQIGIKEEQALFFSSVYQQLYWFLDTVWFVQEFDLYSKGEKNKHIK